MSRVLIADDALDLGKLLKAAIIAVDPTVEVAVVPSAEEAILVSGSRPFDLLIADVRLPGISGLELVERLRKKSPDIKIIVITGLPGDEIQHKTQQLKVNVFLQKPIEMSFFQQTVLSLLPENAISATGEKTTLPPVDSLSLLVEEIRAKSGALAAWVLNDVREIAAAAGDLEQAGFPPEKISLLHPTLVTAASALNALGNTENILLLSNPLARLLIVLVKENIFLLALPPGMADEKLAAVIKTVRNTLPALFTALAARNLTPIKAAFQEETIPVGMEQIASADLQAFEAALDQKAANAEQFWLAAENTLLEADRPDALTYEQAQKLGLTPKDLEKG